MPRKKPIEQAQPKPQPEKTYQKFTTSIIVTTITMSTTAMQTTRRLKKRPQKTKGNLIKVTKRTSRRTRTKATKRTNS
jgi:predicted GIY-YIG superfamily endonuclease